MNLRAYLKIISILIILFASGSLQAKILGCEGDSQMAVRTPLVDSDTYCAKTAARLGWSHINWAVGGSTSADVVARLPAQLAAQPVDCLLVQVGANDAFILPTTNVSYPSEWTAPATSAISLPAFKSNLAAINSIASSASVPWTYITPWAFFSTAEFVQFRFYAEAARDQLATLNVPVIDAFHLQQDRFWNYANNNSAFWALYEQDYQHPSAVGHTLETNEIAAARSVASCAH